MTTRTFIAGLILLLPLATHGEQAAVEPLIEMASLAAAEGDTETVVAINAEISALHEELPPWASEVLAAASGYDEGDADAVAAWQEMVSEAEAALAAGDVESAIAAQESALLISQEVFGDGHWITISSLRDMGYMYRQIGDAEQADGHYSNALSLAEAVLGEDHPQTLEIASLIAELYGAAGMMEQSLMMRDMVAASFSASLGESHAYTLGARLSMIETLQQVGDYETAIGSAIDLCGDIARGYGELHGGHVRCLETLAGLQATTGQFGEAEKTYNQITSVLGRSQPGVNEVVLGNLAQLAEVYRQQGRYKESRDLLSATIQLALQTGLVETSYTARSYLGRTFNNQGEFAPAQQVTEEVLEYGLAHWQDQPLNIYNTMLELGGIYQAQGKLGDAEMTLEDAFAGLMEVAGDRHPSTLVATNNLGQIYEAIGLYDEAEPILKLAVEQFESALGPAHPDTLRARNNLAVLHESQGNFREAEPLYLESLALLEQVQGENFTDTIAVKNNLAFLYMLMEEFEDSAAMFEEVVTQWEAVLGVGHQNTLKARNNLGRVYHRLGRLEEAEALVAAALATRREVLGEDHLDVIRSMIDLGSLYLAQDRLEDAESLASDALAKAEKILTEYHPYSFDALNLLARVRRANGELQAAIELKSEGMLRRSRFLDRMLWSTGENAREGYIRLHRPELDEYLAMLAESDNEDRGRLVLEASLQRKGLLLKVTSEIQQIAGLALDPQLTTIATDLEAARRELASLTLSGPTPQTQGRHAEVLYDLESRVNELQGELGRASVRFRTSIAGVSAESLVSVLPEKTALVDFLWFEDNGVEKVLAGIAIKDDGEIRYELVEYPDRGAIEKVVIDYRTFIQDDLADEDEILEVGQHAYDVVWGPLVEAVGGYEQVYLVPDGVLNILPFNALVDADATYLIQTHDLHVLTSARDLLPNQFKLAQGQYIIMAGPDYDSDDVIPESEIVAASERRSTALQLGLRGAGTGLRGLSFAPLPGAEEEGRIITEQVEKRNEPNIVYFGQEAQEEVLGNLEQPPEILHMATHGFFLEADQNLRKRLLKLQRGSEQHVPPPGDNPLLRAGLAFAGVNNNAQFLGDIDTNNDGVLTALEVLDLDLSGTQLVVLSACETGLGEIHEGEGVYGLRRAFQEAGVAEVVSSLWEVSDAGTQALMTDFYDRLLEGEPAHSAMREAQLALIDDPRWGYPYIWSAFMIVGSYESAGFTVN